MLVTLHAAAAAKILCQQILASKTSRQEGFYDVAGSCAIATHTLWALQTQKTCGKPWIGARVCVVYLLQLRTHSHQSQGLPLISLICRSHTVWAKGCTRISYNRVPAANHVVMLVFQNAIHSFFAGLSRNLPVVVRVHAPSVRTWAQLALSSNITVTLCGNTLA